MKQKDTTESSFIRRSRWTGLMLVLVAAVTLEATSLIQFFFSQNAIRKLDPEAGKNAAAVVKATILPLIIRRAEKWFRTMKDQWMTKLERNGTIHHLSPERILQASPAMKTAWELRLPRNFQH